MPIAMCATLDTPHAAGTDLVFNVSLALAWKKLEQRFGVLRFAPQPALADALSRTVVDGAVSPAWCVADAGFGAEGILERLRSELLSRFSAADVRYLPGGLAPDALLAYGYLSRDLRFPAVFAVRDGVFNAQPVRAFGIVDNNHPHNAARAAQVIVHEVRSEREFVIELCSDAADEDRLLIAQVPPRERLGETVRDVLDRLGRLPPEYSSLRRGEEVAIPRIELETEASFPELLGRPLCTGELAGRVFDEVKQRARFTLDEGGASVTAEAAILSFGMPEPRRSFVVCQPFLVMLIRRSAFVPYLALWVETPAWMQPPARPAGAGPALGGICGH
ncbi:hypothetical protein [Sorangium sp. So ce1097]|uniref:hypothetical protein n=1 Tax=Sorangium sp. So ce1097 TaxID=3133330 RepID=UPI003F5DDB7B